MAESTVESLPGQSLITSITHKRETLEHLEAELFAIREEIEVLWLKIGEMCAKIVDEKLYKLALDENGNPFRTAKAYFEDLDKRFRERGQNISYTSLNRFISDYRLFIERGRLTPAEAVALGKSNLQLLAPAVRELDKQGKTEQADKLVREVAEAAVANGGLPSYEVQAAVDEVTDRVMKGLSVEFTSGVFGKKIKKLELRWGTQVLDVLKHELTEEQVGWLQRRLGVKDGYLP